MSERDRRRKPSDDSASPVQRSARAGAGRTTRDLPARPEGTLPQTQGPNTGGAVVPSASSWLSPGAVQRSPRPASSSFDPASFELHIQQRASAAAEDPAAVQEAAAQGIQSAGQPLPHLDRIQASFGSNHDVSGIQAHVGGAATDASQKMGASAYATGNHVAFAGTPDLHTAAHEAAHVVQQRAGVSLKGGVGQAGDPYEQHADAVADAVVAGGDAAPILAAGPGGGASHHGVQRKGAGPDQMAGISAAKLAPTDAAARIYHHVTKVEDAKTRAQHVLADWRAGAVTLDTAASNLTLIVNHVLVDLHALADADATAADAHAAAEDQRYRPAVHDALTNIARVALQLAQPHHRQDVLLGGPLTRAARPPALHRDDQAVANLTGLLATLQTMGQPLGWTAPATVADAQRARFAFEACPTGADTERPDQCSLPDAGREGLRAQLRTEALGVLLRFQAVAGRKGEQLRKLIESRRASQKLVLDLIGDLFTMATRATGAGPVAMLGLGLALKIGKAQVPAAHVAGQDTATMLEALTTAMTAALEGVSADASKLDDNQLRTAIKALNGITPDLLEARLQTLVSGYSQQIDPIGHDAGGVDGGGFPGQLRGTFRAVRIPRPDGRVRLALVAADQGVPSPTEAALSGQPIGARTSVLRGSFVRWIDPQFEPVIGDAHTLSPQDDITGEPFVDPVDLTTPGAS